MFSSREDIRVSAAEMYALTVVYGQSRDRQREVLKEITLCITSQVCALKNNFKNHHFLDIQDIIYFRHMLIPVNM